MGKALTGLAELGAAAGLIAGAFFTGGADLVAAFALSSSWGSTLFASLAFAGISAEAGALADALAANRGTNITTRQPAANGQVIYGEFRVGGNLVYPSTTGGHKDQFNKIIVFACHPIDAYVNLYLDGRQVFWDPGSNGQTTGTGGISFGGNADGSNHYDAGNNRYNFGGPLVYAQGHYGNDPVGSYDLGMHANDSTWGPDTHGSPYGGDCSYCYIKVVYDAAMFPGEPEIRMTIRGKNNIFDPRTGTSGYTANWALVVADHLMNSEWGFNVPQSMINTQQWIAAANLCDEAVALANGSTEPRYTFNGTFDTSSSPGDILQNMLTAAAGSVTYSGGEWFIWPAASYPVSFEFSEDDLIDGIQGSSYRGNRDLFNRVTGIFTCPNYPYTPFGNLYNANGHDPDGYSQNNFNLAWQKTSYPMYAQDQAHGYASDVWLTQDGNQEKWEELNLPGVISLATAQRLAKIKLLRNRLQRGAYSLKMKLGAWQMMPQDVFTLDFAPYGWNQKLLQVDSIQLGLEYSDDSGPRLYVAVNATDYDPNTYAWSVSDEQTILAVPAYPSQARYDVAPPTAITCTSGPGINVVNGDGVLTPRVQVSWTDPMDAYVTLIDVQWSPTAANQWLSISPTPVGNGSTYITGVIASQVIDVRVRSLRADGAASAWELVSAFTVSSTALSSFTFNTLQVGSQFHIDSSGNVTALVASVSHIVGSGASPTVSAGAGAGSGASVALVSATNLSGYITVTTGSSPASSAAICSVTFATGSPYGSAPKCFVWPSNAAAQALTEQAQVLRANTTASGFVLTQGATALPATTQLEWGYTCTQ